MSKRTENDEIEDSEEISRINKKLKTCSFNYLEHKIQKVCFFLSISNFHFTLLLISFRFKEYGGGLIMCVKENNPDEGIISTPSSSSCPFSANLSFHSIKDDEKGENEDDLKLKDDEELSLSNESAGEAENSEQLELSELEELLDAGMLNLYEIII